MTGESGLSRRTLLQSALSASALGAAAAGAASGCTASTPGLRQRPPAAVTTTAGGDVGLVEAAVQGEGRLLAFLTAAVARHPALATQLAPLQRMQHAHVVALRQAVQPSVGASTAAAGQAVPRRPTAVQPLVMALVGAARRQRLTDCLAAESGALARMLASISASHAVTLDGLATPR